MLSIEADDARAVALLTAIHTGDVDALRRQLDAEPALATARLVDHRGTSAHIAAPGGGLARAFSPGCVRGGAPCRGGGRGERARRPCSPGRVPETALHWAASSDDVEVLDALLDAGADIEATGAVFTGGTPMSDAVVFAQWRAARRLLERGATTTIWQAAALGRLDRVRESCENEPEPSSRDVTNALWHACRGGQQAVAEYLVDRGADLHWVGHDGKTPIDVAHESGDDVLIDWLGIRGGARQAGPP